MDIQARIAECESKFEQKKQEQERYSQLANEALTEITKLQGEWRVLQEMLTAEASKKASKKATVIDAVPEKASA